MQDRKEYLDMINYCKTAFTQIKNNSECENYVFKKSLRTITEIEKFIESEVEE